MRVPPVWSRLSSIVSAEMCPSLSTTTSPASLEKNVETNVDDQVAGEGVAQIVEALPTARTIEPRAAGGTAKHALGHVVRVNGITVATLKGLRAVDVSWQPLCKRFRTTP